MGDIKFKFLLKVGDKEVLTKPYLLGDLIAPDGYIDVVCEYSADCIIKELQYTGIKDKHKEEIYEDDVLKIKPFGKAKVVFQQGSFMAEWLEDEAHSIELSKMSWDNRSLKENIYEVTGNIHENPELLK